MLRIILCAQMKTKVCVEEKYRKKLIAEDEAATQPLSTIGFKG